MRYIFLSLLLISIGCKQKPNPPINSHTPSDSVLVFPPSHIGDNMGEAQFDSMGGPRETIFIARDTTASTENWLGHYHGAGRNHSQFSFKVGKSKIVFYTDSTIKTKQ